MRDLARHVQNAYIETNPRPINFLHMQKFHKNHDKILHITRRTMQKISPKLDKKWSLYDFSKSWHQKEIIKWKRKEINQLNNGIMAIL